MAGSSRAESLQIGPYRLSDKIGEGGTAQVYRAMTADGRAVAVKLLGPGAELDDDAARRRFEREIRVLSELRHPNIVSLLDHGVDDELGPYLVTTLVTGTNARALVGGARLAPEAALLLLGPLCDAVAAMHDANLVHRDLKPENLLAQPDGTLLLADLGLAYRHGTTRYTEEGAVVGSVPYMAPEQVEGGDVTTAADVWAIGVIAYEWMCGKRPFQRERPAEEAAAILVGAYAPLDAAERRASPELSQLVAECLRREPGDRPDASTIAYRARGLIDWIDPADAPTERAAVFLAPAAYTERVVEFRVKRLAREARVAIARGESFAALKSIDRALAYAPDDGELRALSEQAEQAGAEAQIAEAMGVPAERVSHRNVYVVIAFAVIVVVGIVAALVLREPNEPPAPAEAPPPSEGEMAWTMMNRLLNVYERGIEAQENLRAQTAAEVPAATVGGPLGVPPIPPALLSNDADPRPIALEAAGGESLVPADLLGGLDPNETADHFDQKVKDHPGDVEYEVGRALVYLAADRRREGLRMLDDILERHPADAGAWAAKGFVELRRARWSAAERALSQAIELDSTDAQSLRNRGILRHRQGRVLDAYADLTAALRHDPDDVEAMSELMQIYERVDRRDDAAPIIERIVRARPNNPTAWLDLSLVQAPADALASVDRALALAPQLPRALVRRCSLLAQLESPKVVAACDEAQRVAPNDAEVYMARGLGRYNLGDDTAALRDIDRALKMAPDNTRYLINRYIVRSHAGMTDAARADLERACELGATNACGELNGPRP